MIGSRDFYDDDPYAVSPGRWQPYVRLLLVGLVYICLIAFYVLRSYEGLNSRFAFEQAVTARQIARGEGSTTRVIRPFDLWLVNGNGGDALQQGSQRHMRQLWLAPAGPWFQSLGLRLFGRRADVNDRGHSVAEYHLLVPAVVLLLVLGYVLWGLCRRLFGEQVAFLSLGVFMVSGAMLRHGLLNPGLLFGAICVATGLWWAVLAVQRAASGVRVWWVVVLCAGIGGVLGFAPMGHYALLAVTPWVLLFLVLELQRLRWIGFLVALVVMVLCLLPAWIVNMSVTGGLLGAYAYAWLQETFLFPADELWRTIDPVVGASRGMIAFRHGIAARYAEFFNGGWFMLGGWVTALFVLALFRHEDRSEMRSLKWCLAGAVLASPIFPGVLGQGAGINLLVMLPLVIIFGVESFRIFVDGEDFFDSGMRPVLLASMVVISALPLSIDLLQGAARRFPPYHGALQTYAASLVAPESGHIFSDIPEAVAWYADRDTVFIPLEPGDIESLPFELGGIYLAGISVRAGDEPWHLMRLGLQAPTEMDLSYGVALPNETGSQAVLFRQPEAE